MSEREYKRIWNERAQRWEEHPVLVCPPSDVAPRRLRADGTLTARAAAPQWRERTASMGRGIRRV